MNRRPVVIAVFLLCALLPTCHSVPLTAPPGSEMVLIANPEFISANGGVSVITAFITDPTGVPVADGTVVQFFTNLGRVDEQGKTNDGVARVNFVSDSRSGQATITAFSGGGVAPAPTSSPSPTAWWWSWGTGAALAANSNNTKVTIGNLNAQDILLTADPPRIQLAVSRTTHVTATVFDERGNPVAGAPVFFSAASGAMESGGRPIFTDSNGQARDVVRTLLTSPSSTAMVVSATVPGGGGATSGGLKTVDLTVPVV